MCSRTSAALDRTVYYRCPFTEQTPWGFGSALINNTHYKEQYVPPRPIMSWRIGSYPVHLSDVASSTL